MLIFQNQPRCKQSEYGVHVTNSYIHAKRVLLDIYRDFIIL